MVIPQGRHRNITRGIVTQGKCLVKHCTIMCLEEFTSCAVVFLVNYWYYHTSAFLCSSEVTCSVISRVIVPRILSANSLFSSDSQISTYAHLMGGEGVILS